MYTIPSDSWLIPELLPESRVITLQGPAGVGKSLFAAALTQHLCQPVADLPDSSEAPVLWYTHPDVHMLYARYLCQHDGPAWTLFEFNEGWELDKPGRMDELLQVLEHEAQNATRLIILDDFELLAPEVKAFDPNLSRELLRKLEELAARIRCTFLITHQPRTNHPLFCLNNPLNRFIYQLAWHPHDANARLLTVIKNLFGPTGVQFELKISDVGRVSWRKLDFTESVKPSPHRVPRYKKPHCDMSALINTIHDLVTTPAPAIQVKAVLASEGYSPRNIRDGLERASLVHTRRGKDWWYSLTPILPT